MHAILRPSAMLAPPASAISEMEAAALRCPVRCASAAARWSCQMAAIPSRASIVSARFSANVGRIIRTIPIGAGAPSCSPGTYQQTMRLPMPARDKSLRNQRAERTSSCNTEGRCRTRRARSIGSAACHAKVQCLSSRSPRVARYAEATSKAPKILANYELTAGDGAPLRRSYRGSWPRRFRPGRVRRVRPRHALVLVPAAMILSGSAVQVKAWGY